MDMRSIRNFCRRRAGGVGVKVKPAARGVRIDFKKFDEGLGRHITVTGYMCFDRKDKITRKEALAGLCAQLPAALNEDRAAWLKHNVYRGSSARRG